MLYAYGRSMFDLQTFGLRDQHANLCATPLADALEMRTQSRRSHRLSKPTLQPVGQSVCASFIHREAWFRSTVLCVTSSACKPPRHFAKRPLWDSNPRGETPSAQQADALTARPKCLCMNYAYGRYSFDFQTFGLRVHHANLCTTPLAEARGMRTQSRRSHRLSKPTLQPVGQSVCASLIHRGAWFRSTEL